MLILNDTSEMRSSVGENIVFEWNIIDKIGRILVLTDGNYLCPSCKKYKLRFKSAGFWD
jgi:ribosomal protein L37AE/L43A